MALVCGTCTSGGQWAAASDGGLQGDTPVVIGLLALPQGAA